MKTRGSLIREIELSLKGFEARVGTQAIQVRIDTEKNQPVGTVGMSLLQPIHGLAVFPKSRVNNPNVIRRHVLRYGAYFGLGGHRFKSGFLSLQSIWFVSTHCTITFAVIFGWIEQKYVYVPGFTKV